MNTYKIQFVGRKLGSQGTFIQYSATRQAETPEKAIQALYDEYEHIHSNHVLHNGNLVMINYKKVGG